jgi:hypothetical protein
MLAPTTLGHTVGPGVFRRRNIVEERMDAAITFKPPDGRDANGYLANAGRGDAPGVVVIQEGGVSRSRSKGHATASRWPASTRWRPTSSRTWWRLITTRNALKRR